MNKYFPKTQNFPTIVPIKIITRKNPNKKEGYPMITSTQFLANYFPTKPFATDKLSNGISRNSRNNALTKQFIETNTSSHRNLMVIDFDNDDAMNIIKSMVFDDEIIPCPAFVTVNPFTGHAHVGYFIDGFAVTNKQKYLLEVLRRKLTIMIGGDPYYTGMIMRNPESPNNSKEYFQVHNYTFAELLEWTASVNIEGSVFDSKELTEQGTGRNTNTFNKARKWAYKAYYDALKAGSERYFPEVLLSYVHELNETQNSTPLPLSEVRSIVRSVLQFLKKRFSLEKYNEKMEMARAKSLEVRQSKSGGSAKEKYDTILEMTQQGHSIKLACETMGYNYGSVRASWKKWNSLYGSEK